MTNKKRNKKYCSGLDCLTCGETEPCIYRIANELQEQLKCKEEECEELKQWKKGAENLFKAQIDDADKIVNRYKQALDEIEQTISNFPSEGIRDIPQTQIECTQYFLSVSEAKLQKILDIINKTKEGNNNG